MSELRVLDLEDDRWREVIAAAPGAGLFYDPAFAKVRAMGVDRPVLMLLDDPAGRIFDVALLKPVARLPFAATAGADASAIDVASPEYNGPVVRADRGQAARLLASYREAMDRFCREGGVVTEFVRLHPFRTGLEVAAGLGELTTPSEVVYVDVARGYEAARGAYREEHVRAIRRAERHRMEWTVGRPTAARIARFGALYASTVDRHEAKAYHHLPDVYFSGLFAFLGERALLAEVVHEGEVASAAVVLLDGPEAWYMYGGSVPEKLALGSSKLLFDRLIAWAAERGLERLVLGGGFAQGDGLYQFKRGYSPLAAPVRHARKVHDAARHDRLVGAKDAFDQRLGRSPRHDYFPSYWLD